MTTPYLLDPYLTEAKLYEAARLRYIAYRNVNAIDANPKAEFRDKYDLLENTRTCLVYEQDRAVASIRACLYSKAHAFLQLPAFEVYKPEIELTLGLDKKILESNRFVIHPAKMDSKQLFKIPFRFILLNVLKSDCDYCIVAVRAKHVPVYRRFFRMEVISAPKKYPGLNVDMVLMAGECASVIPALMEMEAVFKFSEEEIGRYPSMLDRQQLELS